MSGSFLIVDDSYDDARRIHDMLEHQAAEAVHVCSLADAERHLADARFGLVLLGVPDASSLAGVRRIQNINPETPIVVLADL